MKNFQNLFSIESFKKFGNVAKKYGLKKESALNWLSTYNPSEDCFNSATMPHLLEVKLLRKKFEKMKLTELKSFAQSNDVYIIWKSGIPKNSKDLADSLVLYSLDPQKYIERQQKNIGDTEPVTNKKINVKDMNKTQSYLFKLKLSDLKEVCNHFNIQNEYLSKYYMMIQIIEDVDETRLQKFIKICEKYTLNALTLYCDKNNIKFKKTATKINLIKLVFCFVNS